MRRVIGPGDRDVGAERDARHYCFTGVEVAYAALAVAAVGAGVSAYSAVQQGNAAKSAADYNAAVARNNALQAQQVAAGNEAAAARKAQFLLGQQKAAAGASGVDPNSGSPLSLMTDTAQQTTLDALKIRYGGQTNSAAYGNSAVLDVYQGGQAASAGALNAAGTILGTAGRAGLAFGTAPPPASSSGGEVG